MIGVDTSSFVAFLNGQQAEDVDLVRQAIKDERLVMPPFVVTARDVAEAAERAREQLAARLSVEAQDSLCIDALQLLGATL